MIDNWFTDKCMTLVNAAGRALTGEALEAAEQALQDAKYAGYRIWTDRSGNFFCKGKKLFSAAHPLTDRNGEPLRICGRLVKQKAKFCSKCGGSAPGSWWRCGGCGKLIGSESLFCPHCGKAQNPALRLDISDGSWSKDEDILAEHFNLQELAPMMQNGLYVQENQNAILLEGGAIRKVLSPGHYPIGEMGENEKGDRTLVMVDSATFPLNVCVEKLFTSDDVEADLHAILLLQFNPEKAGEFMRNLMGNSLYLRNDALTASLGYDEVAHAVLADIDCVLRETCSLFTLSELFKSADTRIRLEDRLAKELQRSLSAIGMEFVQLKNTEFESEIFDKLREMSGQIEVRRKEAEFLLRTRELMDDKARREAMSEHQMEEFLIQLAHEKGIRDELRIQEMDKVRSSWERQKEKDAITHGYDVDILHLNGQQEKARLEAIFKQEMIDLEERKKLERRLAAEKADLASAELEHQIELLKQEREKRKAADKIAEVKGWMEIKKEKSNLEHNQKLELLQAASAANIQALLLIEKDPEKRRDLLKLHEQQQQQRKSIMPLLLLAAAAKRGNPAATHTLASFNTEQLRAIEQAKSENQELFDEILLMNDAMFRETTARIAEESKLK